MGLTLQLCSYLLWFPLDILAINAIFRSGVRRYPLIFTYMVVTFLLSVIQVPIVLVYRNSNGSEGQWVQVVHSVAEGTTYTLVLAVVISLINRATSRSASRRTIRLALIAGGFLFMAISFLVHYSSQAPLGVWVRSWSRDLNFCAAVLDLALWALLVATRQKDTRLLLLAGGMGIMFAGEAIGDSVRTIAIQNRSNAVFMLGNVLAMLADCAFLFIWWQTFRKEAASQSAIRDDARSLISDRTCRRPE